MGSFYYDFIDEKQWSPFIGESYGSTNVEFDGDNASGFSFGIAYSLSYRTSDKTELFFKGQTIVTPELTFATVKNSTVKLSNGNFTNGKIDLRVSSDY